MRGADAGLYLPILQFSPQCRDPLPVSPCDLPLLRTSLDRRLDGLRRFRHPSLFAFHQGVEHRLFTTKKKIMRVPLLDNVFCQLSNPPFRMSIVFLQPDHLKAGHRLHMYLEVTSMSLRGQNLMILMRFVTPMVSYPPIPTSRPSLSGAETLWCLSWDSM